ncbi:hypothetical protein FKP32DRAFT_1579471, partial [Trametes sanguinea]
ALLAYEYLITLEQEVRLIWMRKKTGATVLFLVIRYYALFSLLFLQAGSIAPMSDNVALFHVYSLRRFSGLRTLALSGMNWYLASIVFLLASVPFAVNWAIAAIGAVGYNIPIVGCRANDLPYLTVIGVALSRSCMIASDLLVIAITWWYATRGGWNQQMGLRRPSLVRVMVVNGTVYFLVLSVLNVLHLILTFLSTLMSATDPLSQIAIFTDPLTAILICRLLLALHAADDKSADQSLNLSCLDGKVDNGHSLQFASMNGANTTMGTTVTSESSGADFNLDSIALNGLRAEGGLVRGR